MSERIKKFKGTIISGIILFIPVFIILALIEKIYAFLFGFGTKIAQILGLTSIGGKAAAPVVTTILLLIIFYISGLLVRFTLVTRAKEWIENSVLIYVPNYNKYKAKMMTKLQPVKDERQPAVVQIGDYLKPCLIVSSLDSKTTIFIPSTPDTDYGEVMIVDTAKVKKINMNSADFKNAILMSGKGLNYN